MRLPISRLSVQLGAVLLIAAVAACGSSSVTSVPQPSASSSGASTQSVTTSTTSTTSVPPLTVGGITASAVLPIASAAVPLSELVSTSPPGSTPALSAGRLAQSATRSPLDSAPTVLLYIELTSTASVTLNGTPSFSFTVPSVVAGASYYLGFYGTNNGTTGWQAPGDGPATVSGTTLTFAASSTGSVTITPTTPAIVALYYTTPTASPSASPSPAGSAAPALSPTSLTFDANAPSTQTFTVTESGDTAAYTAGIACVAASPSPVPSPSPSPSSAPSPTPSPFIAVLGATSATPASGVATFSVTSGSEVGSCTVTVTDANGATALETINVDESLLGVYSTHRKQ